MDSLEHTFRLLDGQLTTQIADIKKVISHLHSVHSTSLNDCLTYFALALTILNTIIICLLYCRITGSTQLPSVFRTVFSKQKPPSKHTPKTRLSVCENERELELLCSFAIDCQCSQSRSNL